MTAADSLTSALRARVKKYLRGTVFDPDLHPRAPAGAPGGTGGQFTANPSAAAAVAPVAPAAPAAPVNPKERTYDAPVPPVVIPQAPPPPPPPANPFQVYVGVRPAFTGKAGKAADAFAALADWQDEINQAQANNAAPNHGKVAAAKTNAKTAMGNLTTFNTPANVAKWEARTGQKWQKGTTPDPVKDPELYGPREHYRRIYDSLLSKSHRIGAVGSQPVWEVGEFGKPLPTPPAQPVTVGQPAATPQVIATFRPWEQALPAFQAKGKDSQRNIYHALGHMQQLVNISAASGDPLGKEYFDARDTALARLKSIKSLVGLMRSREQGKTVNPNWNSTVAQDTYDHYMGIYSTLEEAAQGPAGAGHPPHLVWAVHEYGQPLKAIAGQPATGTQVPPQGLKVQFQGQATPTLVSPGTQSQPVQQSNHGSGSYSLWGGVTPRHELNLNVGPSNPLTQFQPHPRAYQEAAAHPELNHGDAFDMDYDGPTGQVVTMYHGTKFSGSAAKNGLRWGGTNSYGQGIYTTNSFNGAAGYANDSGVDPAVMVVEVHTGRTIDDSDTGPIHSAWVRRNPRLANRLGSDEQLRRAVLEAGYTTISANISGAALVVLDPARVRILGAVTNKNKQKSLDFRGGGGQLTLPPLPSTVTTSYVHLPGKTSFTPANITVPLLDGQGNTVGTSNPVQVGYSEADMGWHDTPPAAQQKRNAAVDAPTNLALSDEGFKSLQNLAALRAKDATLASKFKQNIADARQVVDTLLPLRVADAATITNMVRSGGLLSRDMMPKVAAFLKQSTDPEVVEAGNKLDAVANSPLFNPSDKQLGLTGFAQLAFGPPMMNLKNSGYGGTADFVLVGKRTLLSRKGVMGGPTSISAYANGQPGATPDKQRWDENTYDGETFKEVMAQRLAMGMGMPWVDGRGNYDDFKLPQAGALRSPDDLLLKAPLYTKETPEIYVPNFVDMSEFSHLLVDENATVDEEVMGAGTPAQPAIPPTPGTPGTPGTPAVTAPTKTRTVSGKQQVMDAATFVAQNIVSGGKLYDTTAGKPFTDAMIERTGAVWYEDVGGQMTRTRTGLQKVNGAWEFVITPAVPGTPGTPGTPGRAAIPAQPGTKTTRKVPAAAYFTKLFADNKIDITVIPTTSNSTPHDGYASRYNGYGGNSPYIDIMYNKASGQSV